MTEDVPVYGTPPISGYRELTEREVDQVNAMKEREAELLGELARMKELKGYNQRWLAIGKTGIEQAFMAINRAILRPGDE